MRISNPCWIHIIGKSVFGYCVILAQHWQVLTWQWIHIIAKSIVGYGVIQHIIARDQLGNDGNVWIHIIAKSILFGHNSKCSHLHFCCKSCCQKLLSGLSSSSPFYLCAIVNIHPASMVFPSQSFSAQNAALCHAVAKADTRNYFLTFSNSYPSYLGAIVNVQRILSFLHPQYFQANPFQLKMQSFALMLQKLSP